MKLYKTFFLLHLLQQTAAQERELIIGGGPATSGEHPFFVAAGSKGCGGSLIHKCAVLTAEHCDEHFTKGSTVYVGGVDNFGNDAISEENTVEEWIPFVWRPPILPLLGDIAVACLKYESTKTPAHVSYNGRPVNPDTVVVMGHGDTIEHAPFLQSPRLKETEETVDADCLGNNTAQPHERDIFCSGGNEFIEAVGKGDSGGPVLYAGLQVGVIQGHYIWEHGYITGLDGWSSKHTDVSLYEDFINDSITTCQFKCLPFPPSEEPSGAPSPMPSAPPTGIKGDPHMTTWSGEKYDFHGVCDLVMIHNPTFNNNLGMDIHIRNKRIRLWSYVSSAVVRLGGETLEVMGGTGKNMYWFNGIKGDESIHDEISATSISRYPITYTLNNSKSRKFVIDLGNGENIVIKTWNKFVSVNIIGGRYESFGSSVGLMGTYGKGAKMSRNNSTVLNDSNTFGQEWQVLSTEENLFHDIEGPQAPQKCDVPSSSEMRRRLGESVISRDDAEVACSRVSSEDYDLCVFDVMASNDKDTAGAY